MTHQQIRKFFTVFARHVDRPVAILLTGAAAGSLLGSVRPSKDVDFAVLLRHRRNARTWAMVEEAAREATRATGIAAQFAENIDRRSMISLLDYRRHTRPYRRFGSVAVRVLEPAYWAIGKLVRSYAYDVQDLARVLKRQRVTPLSLAHLLGRALRASPRSTTCERFRRQVEDFFRTRGRAVWGRSFDSTKAIAAFHRTAQIPLTSRGVPGVGARHPLRKRYLKRCLAPLVPGTM